jgi:hypothetical protein
MPDLDMSVLVSRDELGLPPLEINDFVDYYVGPEFLGGQQTLNRTEVGSPFLTGGVEVDSVPQLITEQFSVQVLGDTVGELAASTAALVAAFQQRRSRVTIEIDGQQWVYAFNRAEFATPWSGPAMVSRQGLVNFSARRQPVAVNGVGY